MARPKKAAPVVKKKTRAKKAPPQITKQDAIKKLEEKIMELRTMLAQCRGYHFDIARMKIEEVRYWSIDGIMSSPE